MPSSNFSYPTSTTHPLSIPVNRPYVHNSIHPLPPTFIHPFLSSSHPTFSVLSWNCLADCYTQRKPTDSDSVINYLQWNYRSQLISSALTTHQTDIICLQEVDNYHSHYLPLFDSFHYHPVYCPRPTRHDGLVTAINPNVFEIVSHEFIYFDDLAPSTRRGCSHAQFLRFFRGNVALLVLLRHRSTGRYVSVANTHLHWNPNLNDVKRAQALYLLERITFLRQPNGLPPPISILMGDFNSFPQSNVYSVFTNGISFRHIAQRCNAAAVARAKGKKCGEQVRFICDDGLSRLARNLRLLGVDAKLHVGGYHRRNSMFETAKKENRIVVSTSVATLRRNSCPEGYLVERGDREGAEKALVELLTFYGVTVTEEDLLAACAKCGGGIELCDANDERIGDKKVPHDRQLLICVRCTQVYWESGMHDGISNKARRAAKRLLSMLREYQSKQIRPGSEMQQWNCTCESNGKTPRVCCGNEEGFGLKHTIRYESALKTWFSKEPFCTNVNKSFVGTLDYIFTAGAVSIVDADIVNSTVDGTGTPFAQLNNFKDQLPNKIWPSDHMMIKATFRIDNNLERATFPRSKSSPLLREL